MLLTTFVVMSSLGFATWLLGHYFQYTGIASIGAVLLIAVGGAIAVTDLQVKTGETVEKEYGTVDNETVVTNQSTTNQYETVTVLQQFGGVGGPLSLGGLVMILGGLLMTHHLNEVAS